MDDSAPRYYSYASYMRHTFGSRMQKLSIDAGFTCPNRDGTLSKTGCTFCNNTAFNPSYCHTDSQSPLRVVKPIAQQIDDGIAFHSVRYRNSGGYLAYFQAYSNTYAPLTLLRQRYEQALSHPQVRGIIIGTRPDCIDDEKLDYLAHLAKQHYVAVEYGIESCYDETLRRINRGHDFATTCHAIRLTARRGLHCGGHLIIGLPGEQHDAILDEAKMINDLPLDSIKLHQLQVLRDTTLAQQVAEGSIILPRIDLDDYISLVCDFVERLRPTIAIERFAGEVPPRYQAMPDRAWRHPDGRYVRNEQIAPMIVAELSRRGTRQGDKIQSEYSD
ncbi:MAG: TIGR01212 family radical SAM protein [Bacteroidales bacterium]|nr:TIGR01212 family radical SAM protein [Bacteroidales bacterium]